MATRLRGTLVDGLNKPIINATVVLLAKGNSLTVLAGSEAIFKTSATGTYDITVQTGYYKVIIGPQGVEPYKAGEIAIYADSKEGTLNNYLTSWAPEELTPEVIAQVKDLVSQAETAKNASASSATKSEQERVKAEAAAKKAEDTANGMKASIGLINNPRDCPDISGNPSSFLGFLRIIESAIGWPSVASGERYLSGFICPTLGSNPTFTGLFIGYLTGSTYTYKWNASSGPLWYKHIKSSEIDRYTQLSDSTAIYNASRNASLVIKDTKTWGAWDNQTSKYIPLAIAQGGTGGVTIGDAKTNLQIPSVGAGDWLEIAAPSGVEAGKYYPIVIKAQYASLYASGFFIDIQTRSSSGSDPMNCCTFNGFIRTGGWSDRKDAGYGYYNRYGSNELALKCILVSAKNAEDNIAVYVEGRAFPVKMRIPQFCTATAVASASTYGEVTFAWGTSNPATDSVGVNTLFDFSLNRVGFYQASTEGNYYIGNGQRIVLSNGMSVGDELSLTTPKITFSGTVAAGNGFIADGTSASNATFYSRYRVGDVIYGSEFRASENAAQVIVRDPTGTHHQFFNFNLNGSFSPPNGLLSSTGVDWNGQINTVNKFYGIAGQVNTPENNVVYGGIHVGFSGNYAFQICGRNGKSFFRTVEAGQEGQWNRLLVKNDYGVGSVAENLPNDASSGFYSDPKAISWAPGSGAGFQSSYDANRIWQFWLNQQSQALFRYNDSGNAQASKTDRPWTTLQAAGTSDINFKRVHGEMDTDVALDNISKLEFVYFNYLSDGPERDIRRGIIAQQAQEVDPQYVHSAETSGKMTLDSNPLLLDALAAIQSLKKKDQDNKDRITKLETEVEELKKLVATLVNKDQPLP